MPNLPRLLLAATLTLVASLAVASSGSAKSGGGADVVKQHRCDSFDFGTVCSEDKYVENETTTPSGNVSFHAHGKRETTLTRPDGCSDSSSTKLNYHFLQKDGEIHESGDHLWGEYSFDCSNEHCTFNEHLHYANGKLQFVRSEFDCTAPEPV